MKTIAKPYLDKCRAGDEHHAQRVVHWVKKLAGRHPEKDLLVVAAYLHDIGWSGVLRPGKVDFDEMLQKENVANRNTETFVRQVLGKLKFSEKDIRTVLRFIAAADRHEARAADEAILVDADNLSKLCVDHVKEKYEKESYTKIVQVWEEKFADRIRTKKGKESYPSLLKQLKSDLGFD